MPPELSGPLLEAATRQVEVWPGRPTGLLTLGGAYPSPTIRIPRGGTLSVRLESEPTNVIGSDGSLLDRRVPATSADLGPGERLEILVDFSTMEAGSSVSLRSLPFRLFGGKGMGMMGGAGQRAELERPGHGSREPDFG